MKYVYRVIRSNGYVIRFECHPLNKKLDAIFRGSEFIVTFKNDCCELFTTDIKYNKSHFTMLWDVFYESDSTLRVVKFW